VKAGPASDQALGSRPTTPWEPALNICPCYFLSVCVRVHVSACVCESESVCVCERERERENCLSLESTDD